MSCETKLFTNALEFEQLKSSRNLNNENFIAEVKEARERHQKLLALGFESRKANRNLTNAMSYRESYDLQFKNQRKIWSIDFEQQKGLRNLA